jgi:PadR family transcriptional regulator, regulatory protein PadR
VYPSGKLTVCSRRRRRGRRPIDHEPEAILILILRTLALYGDLHGFEIAEAIEKRSADILRVEEGSLYPALQRMLLKGWIAGEWGRTSENRRARYYRLTAGGRRHVENELAAYKRVTGAIARILQAI